jgi:HK97 family phage major capsid protein
MESITQTEKNVLDPIVKSIQDLQESIKNSNLGTETKLAELAKQNMALSKAQKTITSAAKKHDVYGEQGNFDKVAGVMARRLKEAGLLSKENRSYNESGAQFWMERAAGLNEEDSTAGASFLPLTIDPEVNKLVNANGVARANCRNKTNIHGGLKIEQRVSRVTVNGVARGDTTIPTGANTYGSITATPVEVPIIATVEEKLIFDSPVDVVNEQIVDIAEAVAEFEDQALWAGDGTSNYVNFTGIKTATGVGQTVVAYNALTNLDPFTQLKFQLHPSVLKSPNKKLYMHPYTLAQLQTLKAVTAGLYFFDPVNYTTKVGGEIVELSPVMDYPNASGLFTTGQMPAVLADLNKAVWMLFGRPGDLRILTERYADAGQIGIRWLYDVTFGIALPKAVARLIITAS